MKIVKTLLLSSLLATAAFYAQALSPEEQFEQGVTAYKQGNYQKAHELFLPLAEQGEAKAQFNLGVMYKEGEGIKQDDYQAFKWFEKAAEQGEAPAQIALGGMYALGKGVEPNRNLARKWIGLACDNGLQVACDLYRELHVGK
ncbi:MAG: tetratricopeptide repeat protein [Pasteurellaceae bacterium]|nr:tetratricopeptide repeat protein [Pasteurellaceae bacterium]